MPSGRANLAIYEHDIMSSPISPPARWAHGGLS
jgi:hypothetical protein